MNKTTLPLVSILIRSMGRPELVDALRSVSLQTWPNLELLVVNASGAEHAPLPTDLPIPSRLIEPAKALNRSVAANQLLEAAKGDYLIFLDEDDWFAPDHIACLAGALAAAPQYLLAYSGVDCLEQGSDGKLISTRIYDDEYDATRLRTENYIPLHAAMFRRAVIDAPINARFDSQFDLFEDWDFWLQCQEAGAFLHVPGVSAFYRIHEGHGEGVSVPDEGPAIQAFHGILSKWRTRYSTEQLMDVFVHVRHLKATQKQLTLAKLALESEMQKASHENAKYISAIDAQSDAIINLAKANDSLSRANEAQLNRNSELASQNDQLQELCEQLKRDADLLVKSNNELTSSMQDMAQRNQFLLSSLEKAQRHIQSLDEYIHMIWRSRSWGITKPLRSAGHLSRGLRRTVYSQLHRAGMGLYRSKLTGPLMALIPSTVKRNIHSALLLRSAQPRIHQESSRGGQHVVSSVGDQPLVSVIIPVFNHAEYITHCIESALAQTWQNLEVIVVDDASTDLKVREILDALKGRPRLTVLHNESNLGICATQNQALIASRGSIIAFLDCDDYLAVDAITTCMNAWSDDTVYLHTGRINVDAHDNEVNRINFLSLPRADYFSENLQAMYATHLKLIRRDAFSKVGLFDERFDSAQDYEMLMRIAFHYPSSSFVHVPDFVYYHRLHSGQTTEKQRAKQDALTQTIQKEARLRLAIRDGDYKRFVSFIMLSYGKHSQTLRAIEGLESTVHFPHEIILYDNGSDSETVEFLRNQIDGKFSNVKAIYGERNLGPAQGRRAAFEHATGEWFIVFDNDEVPEPGWIEELLLRAEANSDVGAVCCRVAFPDETLQFSGGKVIDLGDGLIDLALFDKGSRFDELSSCVFRTVDWCPIGATLFTRNIAQYLHEGYPNVFEDAGVSHALKKHGLKLLNAPGALVWHDHISFQPKAEMREQYMRDRYNPKLMLRSLSSFYLENGKIIHDEYVWRENKLNALSRKELVEKLTDPEMKANKFC